VAHPVRTKLVKTNRGTAAWWLSDETAGADGGRLEESTPAHQGQQSRGLV
jgi:hypothetical protein